MKLLSHSGVGAPWPGEVNFEDKVEVEETIEVPEEQRMLMSGDSGNRGRPLLSRSSCSWNVHT